MAKQEKHTTGTCRYCGQIRTIYLPEGWNAEDRSQDDYDALATEQCDCEMAQTENNRSEKKEKAIARMTEYYDELIKVTAGDTERDILTRRVLERQQALMVGVICAVADRMITAASVGISETEVFTVAVKSKGDLQIKRTYKGTEEWIF